MQKLKINLFQFAVCLSASTYIWISGSFNLNAFALSDQDIIFVTLSVQDNPVSFDLRSQVNGQLKRSSENIVLINPFADLVGEDEDSRKYDMTFALLGRSLDFTSLGERLPEGSTAGVSVDLILQGYNGATIASWTIAAPKHERLALELIHGMDVLEDRRQIAELLTDELVEFADKFREAKAKQAIIRQMMNHND